MIFALLFHQLDIFQFIATSPREGVKDILTPGNTMDSSNGTTPCLPIALASFVGTVIISRLITQKKQNLGVDSSESSDHRTCPQHVSLPTPSQALKLIKTRRSIFTKQFSGKPVHQSIVIDMLEAARWAPNHRLTEPWRFIVFESLEARLELGGLLCKLYSDAQEKKGKPILQAKIDKKLKGAQLSSHIIAICVSTDDEKNPFVEEIASVSMAVQNMHLMATCHGVGAYWSSGGIYCPASSSSNVRIENPQEMSQFLARRLPGGKNGESIVCLGWLYVGDYYGDVADGPKKKWPSGLRKPIADKSNWR
jgi:nitroreductase